MSLTALEQRLTYGLLCQQNQQLPDAWQQRLSGHVPYLDKRLELLLTSQVCRTLLEENEWNFPPPMLLQQAKLALLTLECAVNREYILTSLNHPVYAAPFVATALEVFEDAHTWLDTKNESVEPVMYLAHFASIYGFYRVVVAAEREDYPHELMAKETDVILAEMGLTEDIRNATRPFIQIAQAFAEIDSLNPPIH